MGLFHKKKQHWFLLVLKFLVFAGSLYLVARFFLHAAAKELRIPVLQKKRYGSDEIFI